MPKRVPPLTQLQIRNAKPRELDIVEKTKRERDYVAGSSPPAPAFRCLQLTQAQRAG